MKKLAIIFFLLIVGVSFINDSSVFAESANSNASVVLLPPEPDSIPEPEISPITPNEDGERLPQTDEENTNLLSTLGCLGILFFLTAHFVKRRLVKNKYESNIY